MANGSTGGRPIRLTIVDDNPFVRAPDGTIRPRAATFHRFAEAVVRVGPFGRARYVVPVADADDAPSDVPAVDTELLDVVPSTAFDGAAGYLRQLPTMVLRNGPILRRTLRGEHLCWMKLPASNGPLAAVACGALGVPRFGYVVGSVREVVRGQRRSRGDAVMAAVAAAAYDASTTALRATAPSIEIGSDLFTSTLDARILATIPPPPDEPAPGSRWRIAWAGRVAGEKGLDTLVAALGDLRAQGCDAELVIIGDGPERSRIEQLVAAADLVDRVVWAGRIADPSAYLRTLASAHLFAFPSRAEGVPKALVEAMAVGLPVVASSVGALPEILGSGSRGRIVAADAEGTAGRAFAAALGSLIADDTERRRLAARARSWASDRTAEAEAGRLVDWLRGTFPHLPWPAVR